MQSHSQTNLTRRAAIAGGIAVVAATPALPVLAAPDSDAELRALARGFDDAMRRFKISRDEVRRCEDLAVFNNTPESALIRPGDRDLFLNIRLDEDGVPYNENQVQRLRSPRKRRVFYDFNSSTGETWPEGEGPTGVETLVRMEPWPEAQRRADEIVAAYDADVAHCNAVREQSGLAAAEKAHGIINAELDALFNKMLATPATTLAGLALKLRLRETWPFYNDLPKNKMKYLHAIERDVLAITSTERG